MITPAALSLALPPRRDPGRRSVLPHRGLSIIEKSLNDATLMAIAEINEKGGINGRKIQADHRGRRLTPRPSTRI